MRAPEHEVKFYSPKYEYREPMNWCVEHFGRRWEPIYNNRDGRWCMFWGGRADTNYYRFCFMEERDMITFILRWL